MAKTTLSDAFSAVVGLSLALARQLALPALLFAGLTVALLLVGRHLVAIDVVLSYYTLAIIGAAFLAALLISVVSATLNILGRPLRWALR